MTGAELAFPAGLRPRSGPSAMATRTFPPRAAADLGARATGRADAADLRALADEDLMELAREGEMRAFEVIFDRHAAVALSLAQRICRRRATAEDVVQEAFLALWRHGDRYDRARGTVRSWLLSVVHNRAIDAVRRAMVTDWRNVGDADIAERIAAPTLTDHEALRRDEAARLRGALEELPPEQRRVIELAYFGGLSHHKIAHALELPPGTVKGRMRLGLQKLRIVLE